MARSVPVATASEALPSRANTERPRTFTTVAASRQFTVLNATSMRHVWVLENFQDVVLNSRVGRVQSSEFKGIGYAWAILLMPHHDYISVFVQLKPPFRHAPLCNYTFSVAGATAASSSLGADADAAASDAIAADGGTHDTAATAADKLHDNSKNNNKRTSEHFFTALEDDRGFYNWIARDAVEQFLVKGALHIELLMWHTHPQEVVLGSTANDVSLGALLADMRLLTAKPRGWLELESYESFASGLTPHPFLTDQLWSQCLQESFASSQQTLPVVLLLMIGSYLTVRHRAGDQIGAQDCNGQWYHATVVQVVAGSVQVQFKGWTSDWDEWIRYDEDRLVRTTATDRFHLLGGDDGKCVWACAKCTFINRENSYPSSIAAADSTCSMPVTLKRACAMCSHFGNPAPDNTTRSGSSSNNDGLHRRLPPWHMRPVDVDATAPNNKEVAATAAAAAAAAALTKAMVEIVLEDNEGEM